MVFCIIANMSQLSEYKKARNLRLCARFYFYSNLMGLKSENCYSLLTEEFDISEATIVDLLQRNHENISNFIITKISAEQLKKAYPFMSWRYNHATRSQTSAQPVLSLF